MGEGGGKGGFYGRGKVKEFIFRQKGENAYII
jgi:hypothetical protein